ncbi:MAG: hypothetical protein ACE1Z9_03000 [Acidimicrobiia bacterium]
MGRDRARSVIFVTATLAFALAGSTVASAQLGAASDQPDTINDQVSDEVPDGPFDRPADRRTDRQTDRPRRTDDAKDRISDRPTDKPEDRPSDRVTDRPTDLRRPHRCDEPIDRTFDCRPHDHWHRALWERCWQWVQEHDGVRIDDHRRVGWGLCHRLLWNHTHPE